MYIQYYLNKRVLVVLLSSLNSYEGNEQLTPPISQETAFSAYFCRVSLIHTCSFDRIPPFSRLMYFFFQFFLVYFSLFLWIRMYTYICTLHLRLLATITASGFERLHFHHRKINSYKISLPRRFKASHPSTVALLSQTADIILCSIWIRS